MSETEMIVIALSGWVAAGLMIILASYFRGSASAWRDRYFEELEKPPTWNYFEAKGPTDELIKLMKEKAPWDKK